jgi:hypothetical protein
VGGAPISSPRARDHTQDKKDHASKAAHGVTLLRGR